MKCPRGCDVELVAESRNDLEIDRCPGCNGIWFDQGEGELVSKPPTDATQAVLDELAELDPPLDDHDESDLLACPRCDKTMGRERFAHSHVHIDRCGCGMWLDDGELEKIQAWRAGALTDFLKKHGASGFPPEEVERAFARVYFDVGTPRGA
jgi:Zn-finger nucleic acid-binding protein